MTALRPWAGFDSLVDGLVRLQVRAREAAVRSVDEILTLRNWLVGAWIVAYEQEGADRARYGEGLIDALAAAFPRAAGLQGRMRIKLDENAAASAVDRLTALGHDVHTVCAARNLAAVRATPCGLAARLLAVKTARQR